MSVTELLTSKRVVCERVGYEKEEVGKTEQVQVEGGHEEQYNGEEVLVEGQPDAFAGVSGLLL